MLVRVDVTTRVVFGGVAEGLEVDVYRLVMDVYRLVVNVYRLVVVYCLTLACRGPLYALTLRDKRGRVTNVMHHD